MLPPGAFAVVLLVNGLQVLLPAPAFVMDGRVWAPARPVLERLGFEVRWDAETGLLSALSPAGTRSWPVVAADLPPAVPPDGPFVGWRHVSTVYLPLASLRSDQLAVSYDPAARVAEVRLNGVVATDVSLAALLADPVAWVGRRVRLCGEYLGWSPYRHSYATVDRNGLPAGCFVLRNDTGAIFCDPGGVSSPVRASLATTTGEMPPLTPYAPLGRRIAAVGALRMRADGRPIFAVSALETLTGVQGLTCLLHLDRRVYAPGERATGVLVIVNPGAGPVEVPLQPGGPTLTVASPDQTATVIGVSSPDMTVSEGRLALAAGEQLLIPFAWSIPTGAVTGVYWVSAHVGDGLAAYPAPVEVAAPLGSPDA
ncbi:MAG: hypothetical protein HPY69_05095 [Armatimonadetes bacterium]|nr:hypothetical protein [Armatimonadota bacterium]